jgi:signal transduction histidine kinase
VYRSIDSAEIVSLANPAIIDNFQDIVIVLDRQKNIVLLNESGSRLFADHNTQPLGKVIDQALRELAQKTAVKMSGTVNQKELRIGDGPDSDFYSMRILPIQTNDGEQVGHIMILRNVTAIKKADATIEAERRRSDSLSKLSHDIRTPLSGILGLAEMLELGTFGPLNEKQLKATRQILERSDHLTKLLNELRHIVKPESDQGKSTNQDFPGMVSLESG